jgi:small GTP-binding protein
MERELIIIRKLEKEIGELKGVSFGEIPHSKGSVSFDRNTNVIGLNLNRVLLKDFPIDLSELRCLRKLFLRDTQCDDYSFLKELPQLNELNIADNQIKDISFLKKLNHLRILNLSGNQISDISVLFYLSKLRNLVLTSNQVRDASPLKNMIELTILNLDGNPVEDIAFLQGLINLEELDISDTKIKEMSSLEKLEHLEKLNLNYNNHLNDFNPILKLNRLRTLGLANNELKDVSFLQNTSQIISLDLTSNQLIDISFLQNLNHLTELILVDNQITDISIPGRLIRLTRLDLARNHITDITPLKKLIRLNELNLSSNQISNFSSLEELFYLNSLIIARNNIDDTSFITGMDDLRKLDLSNNKVSDISCLRNLICLSDVNLANNRISDISAFMGLKKLRRLDLRQNSIRELPKEIVDLDIDIDVVDDSMSPLGEKVFLRGNDIIRPPIEIIKKGKRSIKKYFESLETGSNLPLNEVKVLLVGDGAVGKTSLVNRLTKNEFDETEPTTHGIDIDKWLVTVEGKELKVNLWDFGGQEIMHATHQFFFSKRSLYILVLDGRRDTEPEYWLKLIESLGGHSPILVVINKIDEIPGFEVNRKFLNWKYSNIVGFYRISCKTGEGILQFVEALKKASLEVKILETTWSAGWFNIKNKLENMEKPFISYLEYREICASEKIDEESSQEILVDFLHDLGVILHFKDLELKDTSVLDPKWVTEAVYKIINSQTLATCKGVLNVNSLPGILEPKNGGYYDYPPEKHRYILQLMKKFELCYQLDRDHVLIPDLLKVGECEFDFDYQNALKFVFQYDFLPKSIIVRFIVRMHKDVEYDYQWRTGVFLKSIVFHSTAVVKADKEARKIFIYVSGEKKREYLTFIRNMFRDINRSFQKIEVDELVPLPDCDSQPVKYDELVGQEQMGRKEIIIGILNRSYTIKSLLDSIEKEEDRVIYHDNVFKSDYSYGESEREKNIDDVYKESDLENIDSLISKEREKAINKGNVIEEEFYFRKLIEIEEEFQTPIKQYMVYFNEYMKKAKGVEINMEVLSHPRGLELLIPRSGHIEAVKKIMSSLADYTDFCMKEKIDELTIYPMSEVSHLHLERLEMELRNQVQHLKTDIKNNNLELKNLNESLETIRYQLTQTYQASTPVSQSIFVQTYSSADSDSRADLDSNINVKTQTDVTTNVSINIEIELPGIQAEFEELKDFLVEKLPSWKEKLERIEDSLDELPLSADKKELRGPFNKLRRLLEKLGDENSELNKIIKGAQRGIKIAQKAVRTYNKFAKYLCLPQVPEILLGKDEKKSHD